jgi:death-on-curing protein
MPERISLTLAEVVEIDRLLIEEFGGSHGVRDQGGLESAGYRPKTGYYNNLAEEAAALAESLANNHTFFDGNKRIRFSATDTILRINGYYLDMETMSTHDFITESIARGEFRFSLIRDWISEAMRPLLGQGENG